MFERFTEKARRLIFFARYEASQYGSPYIEPEHLLLGLMRESGAMVLGSLRPNCTATDLKSEIDKQIPSSASIPTSVEVPLAQECKKILMRAKDEADHLGHRHIGTEHLLLGLLGLETSLAARLLRERGAEPDAIRKRLAKTPYLAEEREREPLRQQEGLVQWLQEATGTLEIFLAALTSNSFERLTSFFALNSQFVDNAGKRWIGRVEIEKQFEMLTVPYAKKNIAGRIEGVYPGPLGSVLASVLWENVTVPNQPPRAMHRMTIVLAPDGDDWAVYLLQVTPILTR